MTELFDIESEVFNFHIWPKLGFNDLLRMRRASAIGKRLVDDYLHYKPKVVPELEINETEKWNMDKFLEMEIPVTKVFINNSQSGVNYFKRWRTSVAEFLDLYGSKITHLRLHTLSMTPHGPERDFLNCLTGLKSLIVRNWVHYEDHEAFMEALTVAALDRDIMTSLQPTVFKQLEIFNMAQEDVWDCYHHQNPHLAKAIIVILSFLNWPLLSYVAVPMTTSHQDLRRVAASVRRGISVDDPYPYPEFTLYHLLALMIANFFTTEGHLRPNLRSLKTISFEHCYYFPSTDIAERTEVIATPPFLKLATICFRNNIQLEMVNAAWFYLARSVPLQDYGKVVTSLVDLQPTIIDFLDLENLQRLFIKTSKSCVYHFREGHQDYSIGDRPEWPLLKVLELIVDSVSTGEAREAIGRYDQNGEPISALLRRYPSAHVSKLFRFLFGVKVYENLTELRIEFKKGVEGQWRVTNTMAEGIARCCGNVKKLGLINWTGTNLGITKLWEGMTRLEEVSIWNCEGLGNVAFVGEYVTNPVFLRLTSMKKLSLLGLDKMPKLTDTLFRLVISQMKLTHLNLSSEGPLKNVTIEGIRSLLAGPFAETIAKFPFKHWSLDGITKEEFAKMSQQFRSYRMI